MTKKILCIALAVIMLLGLCACGGSGNSGEEEAPKDGLQVGYAKVNITPQYEVGLGGYSDAETRSSTGGFSDYVYTTCIAVTSGEETILIYTIDTCGLPAADQTEIRNAVTGATGIPGNKIFIGATHGHNCPALSSYSNASKYRQDFMKWAAEAGTKALEDRSFATLYRAKEVFEGMNFIRHYTLADGTFVDNSGANGNEDKIIGHPMETDPMMTMLKFDRGEEKKAILMVNWQGHPDSASSIGYNTISPSWIGPLRNNLEKTTGMHVAYFTGASGNQNIQSKMASEDHGLSWDKYGEKMAENAATMLDKMEPVEGTTIKTTEFVLDVEVDHSWDHMLTQANEVYDVWKSQGKEAGDELGKTYGFSTSYHARAIRSKAKMGQYLQMETRAFCIGDIGFTTGTYEMFSTNALFVKENSPFETTFVITGCSSYVPAEIAYSYRSYEADTGFYAKGAAEALADQYVKMLKELKG